MGVEISTFEVVSFQWGVFNWQALWLGLAKKHKGPSSHRIFRKLQYGLRLHLAFRVFGVQ